MMLTSIDVRADVRSRAVWSGVKLTSRMRSVREKLGRLPQISPPHPVSCENLLSAAATAPIDRKTIENQRVVVDLEDDQ
jgi:hypothetical protein